MQLYLHSQLHAWATLLLMLAVCSCDNIHVVSQIMRTDPRGALCTCSCHGCLLVCKVNLGHRNVLPKALQHAGGHLAHENGADDPESASKRRRRSEDRDVAEAAVADADGAPAAGPKPVNGHAVTAANGDVPAEAAFWTALQDAKVEVRPLLLSSSPLWIQSITLLSVRVGYVQIELQPKA